MPNDISSIQNQLLNAAQVHHGGGGHGHGKKMPAIPFALNEPEVKSKIRFQSKPAGKIDIDPDADSKKQQQQQQQQDDPAQPPEKDGETKEKPFGLDTLEIIGQLNMVANYTLDHIKKTTPE